MEIIGLSIEYYNSFLHKMKHIPFNNGDNKHYDYNFIETKIYVKNEDDIIYSIVISEIPSYHYSNEYGWNIVKTIRLSLKDVNEFYIQYTPIKKLVIEPSEILSSNEFYNINNDVFTLITDGNFHNIMNNKILFRINMSLFE